MTSKEYNKMKMALDEVLDIAAPYRDVIDLDTQRTILKLVKLQGDLIRLEKKYAEIERQKKQPSA